MKRQLLAVATALLLVLGVVGCGDDDDDTAATSDTTAGDQGSATTAPAEPDKIKFTLFAGNAASSGVWAADELGYFEENNIEVEYVYAESGQAAQQLLVAGETDFAIVEPVAVANARSQGIDTVMLARLGARPAGAIMCGPNKVDNVPYPEGLKQLEGKKLAAASVGGGTWTWAVATIADAGADPSKVEGVPVGSKGSLPAVVSGATDCGTILQPDRSVADRDHKDLVVLADWEAGDGPFDDVVYSAIVTMADTDSENPDLVRRVADAIDKGVKQLSNKSNAPKVAQAILSYFDGQTVEQLTGVLEGLTASYTDGVLTKKNVENSMELARLGGSLEGEAPPYAEMVASAVQ